MELATKQSFSLTPSSLEEAMKFAKVLSESNIIPKDFAGNPGNILVAIQWGIELGLQPMQAMQNIAVINGRPCLWGDSVIGIVRSSPLCEYIYETDDGETATCRVKRRGEEEQIRTFSMADAGTAGLTSKPGPWKQYPKRMRQMRARAFALRDVFPDVLRGMPIAEEVQDFQLEKDMGQADQVNKTPVLPNYSNEQFSSYLPRWKESIIAGKTTAESIINKVSTKYTLTEDQANQIRNLEVIPEDDFVEEMETADANS